MKLNNIFEGNSKLPNRDLLLQCMREMLLTKEYAPLNVDLFYDQIFDLSNCSNEVYNNVYSAKKVWIDIADHFTVYIDFGIDKKVEKEINEIQKNHDNGFVDFRILSPKNDTKNHLKKITSTSGALNYYEILNNKKLLSVERLQGIMIKNKIPKHLPDYLNTYYKYNINKSLIVNESFNPKRAIIESPFALDMLENVEYAAKVIAELLLVHNKAPIASHLLYTRMLNDLNKEERDIGIKAGLAYGQHAEETIVCIDRGLSVGMVYGINNAIIDNRPFYCFTLSKDPTLNKEVSSLKTLKCISDWIDIQKNKNKNLYKKTGDITNYRYSNDEIGKL
jgi:hypothetical protein